MIKLIKMARFTKVAYVNTHVGSEESVVEAAVRPVNGAAIDVRVDVIGFEFDHLAKVGESAGGWTEHTHTHTVSHTHAHTHITHMIIDATHCSSSLPLPLFSPPTLFLQSLG